MTQTLPGAAPRRGVLAIDEGTTGTRAGVVLDSGAAHEVFYRSIEVSHPDDLSVEQDPMEIWSATVEVARRAVGLGRRTVLHRLEDVADGCHGIGWRWAAA